MDLISEVDPGLSSPPPALGAAASASEIRSRRTESDNCENTEENDSVERFGGVLGGIYNRHTGRR